ncbi:MAG: isoleucine-tRNA ligase [Thelocarpon impressellum]|nr:MAG: isoleucine-tRNA ligase [Thelocarpon impressellum]
MADWDAAWTTMDQTFEARQLEVFRIMVNKGLIYRRFKPVYWSPSSATALAEAELEYKDGHESKAAFIKFPIITLPPCLASNPHVDGERLGALIWTTTPWTLPANKAIAVQSGLSYAVVELHGHGQLLVAESRIAHISQQNGGAPVRVVVDSIKGADLAGGTEYRNVLAGASSRPQPVIHADFVSADSGTGLVHCAPGHGIDDYDVCRRHGIAAYAPVDDEGLFTSSALPDHPDFLTGQDVLKDGSQKVLDHLRNFQHVVATHDYVHKYPYDWRTKQPVIIRATEQWFADVGSIKESALKALEDVDFIPDSGRARLESFVKGRSEWCISRQRAWGVPIPALYHKKTGAAVLTDQSVSHVMSVIKERGIDAWWSDAEGETAWTPRELLESSGESSYRRGHDTMDVWFDSGTSWMQLNDSSPGHRPLADVYLEGTDQHRGWFQSSLLTRTAYQSDADKETQAPFRTLVTHGFTLDHQGRKMSKSAGNVISPDQIIDGSLLPPIKKKKGSDAADAAPHHDGLGPDALRLWVASSDYTRDVVIGQPALKAANAAVHKFRVTIKLLLGALQDFDPVHRRDYRVLSKIDRVALLQLAAVNSSVLEAYRNYEFHRAVGAINRWVNVDLSAFYIETLKDRLYADAADSSSRRSAQTALLHVYDHLLGMLAPVTPLLVEEAWQHTPDTIKANSTHPLQRIYPTSPAEWYDATLAHDLPYLLAANDAVKTSQERSRAERQLGSSLQSTITLTLPSPTSTAALDLFRRYEDELAGLFVVSGVSLSRSAPPTSSFAYSTEFEAPGGVRGTAHVFPPEQAKCPRCWRYTAPEAEALCGRCEAVVGDLAKG